MLYLSKGIVSSGSEKKKLKIIHNSQTFQLTDAEATLWLRGRFAFAKTYNQSEDDAILHLNAIGLVESESDEDAASEYRILTRCVCCPTKPKRITLAFSKLERSIYMWLKHAGLHLSTAELVFLAEDDVKPTKELLYEENRQALIERIYTVNNIFDNLLENQMEHATCRDCVVNAILNLLKKKMIVVL